MATKGEKAHLERVCNGNYRNRKLLDLARDKECQICGTQDGTVVSAHSDQARHGKGMGIKSHDCFIAWTCYKCHLALGDGSMTREDRDRLWQRAHERTLLRMFQDGLLEVRK